MTDLLTLFLVGGIVRDELLGRRSKDVDFACVIPDGSGMDLDEGFDHMRLTLAGHGFATCVETPEMLTIRAEVPRSHPLAAHGSKVCDFVLARWESPASIGRRPMFVKVGDLPSDMERRDFTVNAMARPAGVLGEMGAFTAPEATDLIDLHGGMTDLHSMTLRFVGDPMARIIGDALRVMRALRFAVTKGFTMAPTTRAAIETLEAADALALISEDRRNDELNMMFRFDTLATLELLRTLPTHTVEAMFAGRVRLESTLRK